MHGSQGQKYSPLAQPLGKNCMILTLGYGKRFHSVFLFGFFFFLAKRYTIKSQIPIIRRSTDLNILINKQRLGLAPAFSGLNPQKTKDLPSFLGIGGNITTRGDPVCTGIRISLASWMSSPTSYQSLPLAWPWVMSQPHRDWVSVPGLSSLSSAHCWCWQAFSVLSPGK